jgi:DNA-binding transcriptional ArsR family regulator
MKSAGSPLLPLLRSRTQGEIVSWIVLHPDDEYSLVDIAAAVETSPATVMREVDRLAAAGLVRERRMGNTRLVRANTDTPVYRPLADLMTVTFGPVGVLRDLLENVTGIDRAIIYGSWAARYGGQPGPVPGDIDVLVIGSPERRSLDEAVQQAERRLRREVNVRRVTSETWAVDNGSFKQTLNDRPVVVLIDNGETDD